MTAITKHNEMRSGTDVLCAQLGILQVFLPTDYWVVGRIEDKNAEVVATFGQMNSGQAISSLALMLADGWDSQNSLEGFSYRAFSEIELEKLGLMQSVQPYPKYAIRAALPQQAGSSGGVVLGFLSQQAPPNARVVPHAREIALCLRAIEQTLSLHLELEAAEKQVIEAQQHAQTDSLTQVLNRAGWNQQIRTVLNSDVDCAIAFLDLDLLKYVNDTQGHMAGDQMLQLTAQSIMSILRCDDCVARLGGDEFAILLHDITPSDAYNLKDRLKVVLNDLGIMASIGVAFKSETGCVHDALHLADLRMYEEKRSKHHYVPDNNMVFDFE